MKILAIRGKNLASLEGEFEIDFTAEPLRSAGIFAITGSTGSGKSTLLDALCLALFDDTPRTSRATENLALVDVRDKTINQKDSRNILRRGTSEGSAEVEFVSLSGEIFRSTWSVRRARGKAEGSLQATEFRLFNISANNEEQGRKTELLAKVKELIGLTFEQFTRAVLLAQGDFATFLKARQSEKAELLEKLTGTDIYSRISATLYERFKKSEQELGLLKERIQGIELLSDEQFTALSAETLILLEEIKQQQGEVDRLSASLKWFAEGESLREGVQQAEQQKEECLRLLESAQPRFDYLARLDSVQDIRDCFQGLLVTREQLGKDKTQLAVREEEQKSCTQQLLQIAEQVAASEAEQKRLQDELAGLKPQLKQASSLDIQIAQAQSKENETRTSYLAAVAAKEKGQKDLAQYQEELTKAKVKREACRTWLDTHKSFDVLVSRIELIVSFVNDSTTAQKQKNLNNKALADSRILLESETTRLKEVEQEAEQLNRIIPSEIAALRLRLQEGSPCPVCGSVYHPTSGVQEETLEEQEINKAKKKLQETTGKLLKSIELRRNELVRLQSLVENYTSQTEETESRLQEYLNVLPEWQTLLQKGELVARLRNLAHDWSSMAMGQSEADADVQKWEKALQMGEEQLKGTTAQWSLLEQAYKECTTFKEKLRQERASLFSGRSVDEVEADYSARLQKQAELLAEQIKEKQALTSRFDGHAGTITQLKQAIAESSARENVGQSELDSWLKSRGDNLSREEFGELLSHDSRWIATERMALNTLQQNRISAEAAFHERLKLLQEHADSADKAAESTTREQLQEKWTGLSETLEQKKKRRTELEITLANHAKGKEKIKAFEQELNDKTQASENWKKLNELYGSADGSKFKVLAQGYTLEALLAYANRHLQELTGRYVLQRIPETLGLQVVDQDMLGEIRAVHSLSGGESFLISLALALGLSSLSSNRMKVESLFVDEGFGSLDVDTLRVAMDALERLQTQGRKIGVISHVSEMTERIATQIRVVRNSGGKSRIEVR